MTTDGRYGRIKLENTIQRWCAIKVNKVSGEPEVHYLSPADPIMSDPAQLLRYAARDTGDYYYSGSEITLDTTSVTSFQVFAAHARGIALIAVNGWPPNTAKANNADYELLNTVCIVDFFAVAYTQICNIAKAAIPLECFDALFDVLSYQIQRNIARYATYDVRLEEAIAHEGNSNIILGMMNCGIDFETAGSSELLFTFWDIIKAICDFVENVPVAMKVQAEADTFSQININNDSSIEVTSPPTTTTYLQTEMLDLRGMTLSVNYGTITPPSTFVCNTTEYQSLGVVTDPAHGSNLGLQHTQVNVTIPQIDIRYLKYEEEYLLHLGRLQDPTFSHNIPITVEEYTGPVEGSCSNPVISNSISINSYDNEHQFTLNFPATYKMCTEKISDADSMNGETVMLYFFKSDGSGDYSVPSAYSLNEATLSATNSPYNLDVSVSPLPDFNSDTYSYYTPETIFGYKVINFSTLSSSNDGDFLWLKSKTDSESSWVWTIVNTEWLEDDGTYTGNY